MLCPARPAPLCHRHRRRSGAYLKTYKHPGPYIGMKISGASGISATQQAALKALGAAEE